MRCTGGIWHYQFRKNAAISMQSITAIGGLRLRQSAAKSLIRLKPLQISRFCR